MLRRLQRVSHSSFRKIQKIRISKRHSTFGCIQAIKNRNVKQFKTEWENRVDKPEDLEVIKERIEYEKEIDTADSFYYIFIASCCGIMAVKTFDPAPIIGLGIFGGMTRLQISKLNKIIEIKKFVEEYEKSCKDF